MKFTSNGIEAFIQHFDGSLITLPPVSVEELSAANPARITVDFDDIAQFANGDSVEIIGATGDATAANGVHRIQNVDSVMATFELVGVDLLAATGGPWTTGLSATPKVVAPPVNIISMSNTKPVLMIVALADVGWFSDGDVVQIAGTNTSLDGRAFFADNVGTPTNTITLRGADLTKNQSFVTGGTATPLDADDFYRWCLSSHEYERAAADAIDVSTFCGPESLAGVSQPGTITIEAPTDFDIDAYNEWRDAVTDGQRRLWLLKIPRKDGTFRELVYVITPSGLTETMDLNDAVRFTGTAVVNEEPLYLVA